ncbi:MAG: EamA-like transporter family protein [Proteobacteria bacterium]|nr:EamA-like transporter family protein [Pseudomonadota bacterium]
MSSSGPPPPQPPVPPNRAPLKALIPLFGSTIVFACLDTTAKVMSYHLPVIEISWFRYVINLMMAVAVLNPLSSPGAWRFRRPGLQIVRALLLTAMTLANFSALHYLQVAEVTSIGFLSPMVITLLSVVFLHETIGIRRVIAIVIGFLGVLLITQPGFGTFHPAMLLALASMLSGAIYNLVTRYLATRANPGSLVISLAAVPSLLLLPPLFVVWQTPSSPLVWGLLVFMGAAGGFGHFLVLTAHRYATAATLAPYGYIQLVWTIISGYLIFTDVPSIWTLLGAGVVIASGLYLLHRERVVHARERTAAARS